MQIGRCNDKKFVQLHGWFDINATARNAKAMGQEKHVSCISFKQKSALNRVWIIEITLCETHNKGLVRITRLHL